jgi:hypothetical protein
MGRQKSVKMNLNRMDFADIHTETRRTPTKAERLERWHRLSKKLMRQYGLIGPKIPSIWTWTLSGQTGTVSAMTRSEARSAVKKVLEVKSLPAGIEIVEVKE